jgi:hypothetical protein
LIDWPKGFHKRNRADIDRWLEAEIRDANKTLLGEIDLFIPRDYFGISASYFELASSVFSEPGYQSKISLEEGAISYAASTAVWTVGTQQHLGDGKGLFNSSGLNAQKSSALAVKFNKSIQHLGLEGFGAKILKEQPNLTLARLHAVLPNYALAKYRDLLRREMKHHKNKQEIFNAITESEDISKSVTRLFAAKPDLGLDLLDRSIKSIETGISVGLPSRISAFLHEGGEKVVRGLRRLVDETPSVRFDPSLESIYSFRNSKWHICNEAGAEVNTDELPDEVIFAKNAQRVEQILDPTRGFLIFDSKNEMVVSGALPKMGWLLWNQELSLDFDATPGLTRLPEALSNWRGWRYIQFVDCQVIRLGRKNGESIELVSRNSLDIPFETIAGLSFLDDFPVFNVMPEVPQGFNVQIIDNISHRISRIDGDGGKISELHCGLVDVSVYAGLGRAKEFQGVYLPGVSVKSEIYSLLPGASRKIQIAASEGWLGPSEVELHSAKPTKFSVKDPTGATWEITAKAPVIEWSVRPAGKSVVKQESTFKYSVPTFSKIPEVVIHNVIGQEVTLTLDEAEKQGRPISASIRGTDYHFDLRPFHEITSDSFWFTLKTRTGNYKVLEFRNQVRNKEKIGLHNLLENWVELSIENQKEWQNYINQSRLESIERRNQRR